MNLFKRKEKATGEILAGGESAIANKEVEGLSQGQIVRRRFFRHRAAVGALVVLTSLSS
jgi:peptide/nickel transport system permease protein